MSAAPPASAGPAAAPPAAREVLGWFLLFGVLAVLWTWPLAASLHEVYLHALPNPPMLGRADVDLTTWILAWGSHALRTAPWRLFDTNAFHPLPNTLSFSEHLLAGAVVLAPIDLVFGQQAVRDQNLLVLASFVVGGAGTALLARELGTGRIPALLAGALFAFHSGRFASIMHVQSLSTHWLPLALLFLHRLLRRGRVRDGAAFAVCLLLQMLSSIYWYYYAAIAVGLAIVADAACRCPAAPRARWKAIGWLAVAGAATLPIMLQYLRARDLYALGRTTGEAWFFGGKLITYLGPLLAPGDFFARRFAEGIHPYLLGPAAIALVAVALAGGAPAAAGGRRRSTMYGLVLLGMMLISLGPLMQVATIKSPGIPGPHVLLELLVPGFRALRTPSRACHVAMLPAAVLVGFGADWLARRAHGVLARRALAGVLVLAGLTETWAPRFHAERAAAAGAEPPPAYRFLLAQPGNDAVAELPFGAAQDARAMALSTWHWRPIVNGYSGFTPTSSWLRGATFGFPNARSLRTLWELGVRWIVVRPGELFPGKERVCDAPPADTAAWMRRRFAEPGLCVFQIVAEPPPPASQPDRPVPLDGARITTSSGDPAPIRDGDAATHWVEEVSPWAPGWVQVELPRPRVLTRAVLRLGGHFGEFARHLQIQVSDDGVTWRQVAEERALPAPALALRDTPHALASTVPLPSVPTRFLRLVRPAQGETTAIDLFVNWQRWGIHELELYEAAGPAPGA